MFCQDSPSSMISAIADKAADASFIDEARGVEILVLLSKSRARRWGR